MMLWCYFESLRSRYFLLTFVFLKPEHITSDCVRQIIQSDHWEVALHNLVTDDQGTILNPLRRMIIQMPGKLDQLASSASDLFTANQKVSLKGSD